MGVCKVRVQVISFFLPLITPTQPGLVRQGLVGGQLPVSLAGFPHSETGAEFWSVSSSSLIFNSSLLTVGCKWLPLHKWWILNEAVSRLANHTTELQSSNHLTRKWSKIYQIDFIHHTRLPYHPGVIFLLTSLLYESLSG